MTHFTKLTALALASALIATLTFVPVSTSQATPIDHMVDCSDSFWAIACFGEAVQMPQTVPATTQGTADLAPEAIAAGLIRIDHDPVCEDVGDDVIVCHT